MKRFTALVFPIALIASSTFAQTVPKPDGQWRGSLGLGMTATSGNNDSVTFSANGDVVKQTDIDKTSGYLQGVHGRRNNNGNTERTSDQIRGGAKDERNLNDQTFGFGALDLERNRLINLKLRGVVASGLGYHVIKRDDLTFDVSTGPAYNREIYTTETREAVEWLIAEESTHALSPTVSFRQRLAYYASLKESGEFRAVFDTGFVFKVTSRWSATVTLNNVYQSNPLPGNGKNDLLFVTGLQYVFEP